MKRLVPAAFLILALVPGLRAAVQSGKPAQPETLRYGSFGVVRIYRESQNPAHVALFFSGEGGWSGRVAEMAESLAGLGTLVVGIDSVHYLRSLAGGGERCSYYSGDLEDLSHFVQQKLGFPRYVFPVLAGYSSGAALAYATLVQAPTGTFRGGISLGFCSKVSLPKPPCRGNGLQWKAAGKRKGTGWEEYVLEPSPPLPVLWMVVQGDADKVCTYESASAFVKNTGRARIVPLPGVGHGFGPEPDWIAKFKWESALFLRTLEERETTPKAPEVRDLPLVEIPASGSPSDALAVMISGDGGWAGIDRGVGQTLAANGVSVVGLNSLQYFWTRRTPETAAEDFGRILRHYLIAWGKREAILIGYSLGADVLPFMTNRLPADLLSNVRLVVLLGPSATVDFEFHFADWFRHTARKTDYPVGPEVEKLRGKQILCVYGVQEGDSLCRMLPSSLAQPFVMKDGHHFGGDYKAIAEIILAEVKPKVTP